MLKIGTSLNAIAVALGGLRPALNLDFTSGSLDPRITFTRASTATRINSVGLLETVAANQPRFDYGPVTLEPKGLLIEEARTNLFYQSNGFDAANWTKSGTTFTPNVVAGPDGALSAGLLVEDTSNGTHRAFQAVTLAAATAHTLTYYLKRYNTDWAWIYNSSDGSGAWFNLATGTVGTVRGTGASASIVPVGNGWYRCGVTFTTGTAASKTCYVAVGNGDDVSVHVGTNRGVYIWGAQLEAGSFATSYIPTTSAAATRAADNATMFDIGWLTQGIGTVACEFNGQSSSAVAACIAQVTINYAALIGYNSAVAIRGIGRAASNTSPTLSAPGAVNTPIKAAYAYAPLDRQLAVNNVLSGSDITSPVITDADRLMIGSFATSNILNGHIKRIRYWPTRLPNAKLQELTA